MEHLLVLKKTNSEPMPAAAWGLDLDNLGAIFGEELGGEIAGSPAGDLADLQSLEGFIRARRVLRGRWLA